MNERPTLYILDGYSRIYQVYHAIDEMTGPAGQPTHAVFGIVRDLLNILKARKPDYLAVAFEGGGPVFRSEIFADYKAQRGPMPDDLRAQIPVIKRVFEAFRIPILAHSGMEADDIIATLARRAAERGMDVTICTADKDARQLLTDQIRILNLRDGKFIDAPALLADWGIAPGQVVDYLALTGDTVDNVPGVPGIGPVSASGLLKEFGTLDNLLANIDRVKGAKKQQNLREHSDTARRARELVQLREDLPLELDWDALKVAGYDARALIDLCTECGFHRFQQEIAADAPPRRGRVDRRLPDRRHPRNVRFLPGRPPPAAALLLRHRDHLDRPPAGRHRRLCLLVGPGRLLLSPRPRARGEPPARPGRHAGGAAADPDGPGRREGRPEPQV